MLHTANYVQCMCVVSCMQHTECVCSSDESPEQDDIVDDDTRCVCVCAHGCVCVYVCADVYIAM